MIGPVAFPLTALLGAGASFLSMRLHARGAGALRYGLVALLLPGLALALWPHRVLSPTAGTSAVIACRTLGVLPLSAVPVLFALGRIMPGQRRAAAGLGAGQLARLRWLWLPQLGPACALGLLLAGLANVLAAHTALFGSVARP